MPWFNFNKELVKALGCPIVRFDYLPFYGVAFSLEADYISDKFSKEEEKVFNAWRSYSEKIPINEE